MQQTTKTSSFLQKLTDLVDLLDRSSKQMIRLMEYQIDAIIGSDAQKIESLSDEYSAASWKYKHYEQDFIAELNNILNDKEQKTQPKLLDLKERYPELRNIVDIWHRKLSENAKLLQTKHNQIIQLLEFAMKQNSTLMHSLYTKHNETNSHYAANGDRSAIRTGVAVNQEV